tara:strand:- start:586 stop:798 length:213 start_codon:yes stop_codon:yes gene_type:complete
MVVGLDDKRPNDSVRDCDCRCHNTGIGKAGSTTRILGHTHNSIDLYISTPPQTKWVFLEKEEVGDEAEKR